MNKILDNTQLDLPSSLASLMMMMVVVVMVIILILLMKLQFKTILYEV